MSGCSGTIYNILVQYTTTAGQERKVPGIFLETVEWWGVW